MDLYLRLAQAGTLPTSLADVAVTLAGDDRQARKTLAARLDDPAVLARLTGDRDRAVRVAAACNPSCPAAASAGTVETLPPDAAVTVLGRLADRDDDRARTAFAGAAERLARRLLDGPRPVPSEAAIDLLELVGPDMPSSGRLLTLAAATLPADGLRPLLARFARAGRTGEALAVADRLDDADLAHARLVADTAATVDFDPAQHDRVAATLVSRCRRTVDRDTFDLLRLPLQTLLGADRHRTVVDAVAAALDAGRVPGRFQSTLRQQVAAAGDADAAPLASRVAAATSRDGLAGLLAGRDRLGAAAVAAVIDHPAADLDLRLAALDMLPAHRWAAVMAGRRPDDRPLQARLYAKAPSGTFGPVDDDLTVDIVAVTFADLRFRAGWSSPADRVVSCHTARLTVGALAKLPAATVTALAGRNPQVDVRIGRLLGRLGPTAEVHATVAELASSSPQTPFGQLLDMAAQVAGADR